MDHSIDNLLYLHDQIIEVDKDLGYWVKFFVKPVDVTDGKPHGISYSLTLHDSTSERIMGFDNAHSINDKTKGQYSVHRKVTKWDHKHKLKDVGIVTPYEYETADKLMVDFWAAVDEAVRLEKNGR